MLTKCPECDLQVSDKAYTCPHCGYPLKYQSKRPYTPQTSLKVSQKTPKWFRTNIKDHKQTAP